MWLRLKTFEHCVLGSYTNCSQIASWLQCFTLQLWVWWRTDTCEIDFVCNPFTSLIQKYIFTEQSLYLSAVSSTNGYQSRRPNSITTHHFKFIASSYKFSDFTTLDIRVEGLLRYISMSQLANSELKQTYSTVASDQGAGEQGVLDILRFCLARL